MFGELLGVSARAHGVVGLVIDAGVRDVADLTAMDFPVWSKAISAQGTVQGHAGLGQRAGGLCAARRSARATSSSPTSDGVVVVPRRDGGRRGAAGARPGRQGREDARTARKGELGLDFYGLRAKLAELGVRVRGKDE